MSYLTNPYMVTPAAIPCTSGQVQPDTNDGTVCTGWGTNPDQIWSAITTTTVAENDKIEKIGAKIGTVYHQPQNAKMTAYTDNSGTPLNFICMTENTYLNGVTGYVDMDVVNAAGVVEAHTITASEAGLIWIGWWGDNNTELCFKTGVYSRVMEFQTYDTSSTATPEDPYTVDVSHLAQLRARLTICEV